MLKEVHYNRALYARSPEPGKRYRQIVVVEEAEHFEVRVFEGEVLRNDAEFTVQNDSKNVKLFPTPDSARSYAEQQTEESVAKGWVVYGR